MEGPKTATLRTASLSKVAATSMAGTTTIIVIKPTVAAAERPGDLIFFWIRLSSGANRTASVIDQTMAARKGIASR